ncbi:MAG: hypothetical protein JWQ63_2652 [Mucilaginibacter sp.]|jgi:hypothetical protein|nr:hypothetical protein [Mucilaginibacter sp.]
MRSICKPLSFYFSLFLVLIGISAGVNAKAAESYYYELKIYHLKTQTQEDRLDQYLQNAYLPAMHRMGIKNVGVFKPVESDTSGKRVYVLTPFRTWSQFENLEQKLMGDNEYVTAAKDYIDAPYNDAPYTRLETIVLKAFPKMTEPAVPNLTANKTDRVYELRSYESATEKFNVNKVRMFNDGNEVALFKRLGFNAVFYAEVLAGSHQPNLMYMTTFNSRPDRDKHWDAFSNDPEWKTLVAKPEYQHNVSKADIIFLHPTAYSDF